jgi:hypothetical protein
LKRSEMWKWWLALKWRKKKCLLFFFLTWLISKSFLQNEK